MAGRGYDLAAFNGSDTALVPGGASLGKMPTTSERRPISLLTRSRGLVERSFVQCSDGNASKAIRSSSASSSNRQIWRDRLETLQDVPDTLTGVAAVFGVEHLSERGGHPAALITAAVREHVSDEVNSAALPWAARARGRSRA